MAVNPHTCSHLRPLPLVRHLLTRLCFIHQLVKLTQAERTGGGGYTHKKKNTQEREKGVRAIIRMMSGMWCHWELSPTSYVAVVPGLIRYLCYFFHTSLCNLTQPVQPTPRPAGWQEGFQLSGWLALRLGEELRTVSLLSIRFTGRAAGVAWHCAAVCSFITRLIWVDVLLVILLRAVKIWEQVLWGGRVRKLQFIFYLIVPTFTVATGIMCLFPIPCFYWQLKTLNSNY